MSDEQAVPVMPEENGGGSAWKVIGIVLGVILLICCGLGTWIAVQATKVGRLMQEEATPIILAVHRMKVTAFVQRTGELPESLLDAEPESIDVDGGSARVETDGQTVDTWGRQLRFTVGEDGSFEIRSGGPDGVMDNEDDLVESGHRDDSHADAEKRFKEATAEVMRETKDDIPFPFNLLPMEEILRDLEKEAGSGAPAVDEATPVEDGAAPEDDGGDGTEPADDAESGE